MKPLALLAAVATVATGALTISAPAIAQDAKRAVTHIAGDVYRFQNNFHFSVFIETEEGVIVTDPINAEAAAWLKGEIAKQTDKPITHLIYSHSHGDHASGGAAFGDVPTVIAQDNAPETIDGVAPTERFADTKTLEVGGKTLELTYLGVGHGDDLIAMVIRPENIGFIVDAVAAKRLPYQDLPRSDVGGWIDQTKVIEDLDFEILAGGHGPIGDKQDAVNGRVYMEVLRDQVLAGLKEGKSVEELQEELTLDDYKDWGSYKQWRALNIAGMARWLQESGQVN